MIDAKFVAHLLDVPPQSWTTEKHRFEAVQSFLGLADATAQDLADGAADLGISVRSFYRIVARQRSIRAGHRTGNGKLHSSTIPERLDGEIARALDDLDQDATFERTRRLVEARCLNAGLIQPSSKAIRCSNSTWSSTASRRRPSGC